VRLFDGRGANKPGCVKYRTGLARGLAVAGLDPPDTARSRGLRQADLVRIRSAGQPRGPVYVTDVIRPGVLAMETGRATPLRPLRGECWRNPFAILPATAHPVCGGPSGGLAEVTVEATGRSITLATPMGAAFSTGGLSS